METSEFIESAKKYIEDRLRNPYFASVVFVWISINRIVVFGLFNFDKNMTLIERISWVSSQIRAFHLGPFSGFWGGVCFSFLIGLVTMIAFNFLSNLGKAIYKLVSNLTTKMLQKVPNSDYVSGSEYSSLYNKYVRATNELHEKRNEVIELSQEIVAFRKTKSEIETKLENAEASLNASSDELRHDHTEFLRLTDEITDLKNLLFLSQNDFNKLSDLFVGVWKNSFTLQSKQNGSELFTIKDDEYIVKDKPIFRIENFMVDGDMVYFDKVHLTTNVRLANRLKIRSESLFVGTENLLTTVEYSRQR